MYTSAATPPIYFDHQFNGLIDDERYYVRAVATTVYDTIVDTGMNMIEVNYSYEGAYFAVTAINNPTSGYVQIVNNIVEIDGLICDIEKEIEQSISYLIVDVLKVSHHGSSTSTTEAFLKKTNPKNAIIMSGRSNSLQFPSTQVINRLQAIKCNVYCTKNDYTITMKIKKNGSYKIDTLKSKNTFN